VNKAMFVFCVLMSSILTFSTSSVNAQTMRSPFVQLVQDAEQFAIAPSQAAVIARDSVPGSKVLNVKLLPSGVYAVTLKVGGSVTRVMVDATSGDVS
jgi:uncharacterized membrane protein YkoI